MDGERVLWLRYQSHLDERVGYKETEQRSDAAHGHGMPVVGFLRVDLAVWRDIRVLLLRSVKEARLRLGGHRPRTTAELAHLICHST